MASIMLCCLEQEGCLWQWGTSRIGSHFKKESPFPRSALQWRMQCTASEMGKTGIVIASPVLDKRKGRKDSLHIRVTVAVPRKFLLSRYGP